MPRTPPRTSASVTTCADPQFAETGEVVESIDKVLSVDLVANPATTGGLFELRDGAATAGARVRQEGDLTILPDGTRFNTRGRRGGPSDASADQQFGG